MNGLYPSRMEKGSASSSFSSSVGAKSLGGLKFGEKIYFKDGGCSGFQAKTGVGPAAGSPAKKGRTGAVNGGQPPRCQVQGCDVDLSDAKLYYSRHKVCGEHSKTPMVIVAGLEQRFCQQCSRFHQLPEFDKGKRSCRRRLAGHNERRRKPPTGSLLAPRSIFESYGKSGTFTVDFSVCPNVTAGRGSWPNMPSEGFGNQGNVVGKFQRPWQSNSPSYLPDLLQGSTARFNFTGHGASSGDCFNGVSDSSSALSLLSNQPWDSSDGPLSLGINSLLNTNIQPSMSHSAATSQYACPTWSFKGAQPGSSLHELPHHVGSEQISQPLCSQYAGELVLAQQGEERFLELEHSRGYETSVQDMHWSL